MKYVFVVGAPRSGTTYLARAMGLAKATAYFEEAGIFAVYGPRRFPGYFTDRLKESDVFSDRALFQGILRLADRLRQKDRLAILVERMLLHTKVGPYDLKPSSSLIRVQRCMLNNQDQKRMAELCDKYRALEQDGFPAVCQAYFDDFLALCERPVLVEKTPAHIEWVPIIRAVYPEAGIVMIHRDKRDSLASFLLNYNPRNSLQTRFLPERNLIKRQCQMCVYYEQIENWLRNQSWCKCVEYKSMVESPLEEVTGIWEWMGLDEDPAMQAGLFVSRKADSRWEKLSKAQKRLITHYLGEQDR